MTDTSIRERFGSSGELLALLGIVLVGAALRLYRIGSEDYWIDEVAALRVVQDYSWVGLFTQLPLIDRHPGLFFSFLKGWVAVVGEAEAMTRLLPAVFGTAALVMLYLLGRRLFDGEVALYATALLAVSRLHVYQSQNIRMYSLLVFLSLLSTYLLLDLRVNYSRRTLGAYLGSAVLLGNTHIFAVLVLAAHACYIFATEYVVGSRTAVGVSRYRDLQFAVGLGISPGLVGALGQAMAVSGGASRGLSWIDPPGPFWPVETLGAFLRRDAPFVGLGLLAGVTLLGLLVAVWKRGEGSTAGDVVDRLRGDERTYLLAGLVAFPLLVPFVVSYLLTPLAVLRYTIPASLGLFLLVGVGLRSLPVPSARYVLVAVLLVGTAAGLPAYYAETDKIQWSNAAATIHAETDGDPFVVGAHEFDYTFKYYLERAGGGAFVDSDTWAQSEVETALADDRPIWVTTDPRNETASPFVEGLQSRTDYAVTFSETYHGVTVTRFEPGGNANG